MSPLAKKFWAIFFPVALLVPTISSFLPIETVEIDNERIVAPAVSLSALTDPGFYRELAAFARDASPVRAWLIRASSALDYYVLSDSPAPISVLVGDDGWLFGREAFDNLCQPTSPETAAQNLIDTVAFLEELGVQVVFTVTPAKFTIHPNQLTDEQQELGFCAEQADQRLRDYLEEHAMSSYVDSWRQFETVLAEGSDAYFKTDTHFNYEASMGWIRALVNKVQPGIWNEEALVDLGDVTRIGNLMTLIGLGEPETSHEVVVDRGFSRVPDEQLHDRFSEDQTSTERYTNQSDQWTLIEGKALVIKDSFFDIPDGSFVQYFEDVTLTDWRSGTSIDYFLENAADSDVVIIETSEEGILERFGTRELLDRLQEKISS